MSDSVVKALIAFVLIVVVVGLIRQVRRKFLSTPYKPNAKLLSAAEAKLFRILEQACGTDLQVFVKVRLADLLTIDASLTGKARIIALNRVAAKHVDFVLCRRVDLTPVCVIELNDSSHNRPDRSWRDRFVAEVCKVIGLPLMVVPVRRSYDLEVLRSELQAISAGSTQGSRA